VGTTRDVTTTTQFTRDTPGNRYNAAVYELLAEHPGQEFSVRQIIGLRNPEDYGTRTTSAIASVSTRWIAALPGDPWLQIHRRAEERAFYYRWEPEPRQPLRDKPAAAVKRESLANRKNPQRKRGWKKGRPVVTPVEAPPNELEWAQAHKEDADPTARKVAHDILKAHNLATKPQQRESESQPRMSHRLKLTVLYLGKGNNADTDRIRKRVYRLRGCGLDDDMVAEILPHVADWDMGKWRTWVNAEELDLDAVFPPTPPEDTLLDKVDHLREIVGNHVEPEAEPEEPQLAFLPEAEVEGTGQPDLKIVAHEGFRLGETTEIIGFSREGHPYVRDTEGTVYKIVEV
jgi:hypothetical protein